MARKDKKKFFYVRRSGDGFFWCYAATFGALLFLFFLFFRPCHGWKIRYSVRCDLRSTRMPAQIGGGERIGEAHIRGCLQLLARSTESQTAQSSWSNNGAVLLGGPLRFDFPLISSSLFPGGRRPRPFFPDEMAFKGEEATVSQPPSFFLLPLSLSLSLSFVASWEDVRV